MWLPKEVCPNHLALSWQHGRWITLRESSLSPIQHFQWSEIRFCAFMSPLQSVIYLCLELWHKRPGQGGLPEVSAKWFTVWPLLPCCKDETLRQLILEALFADNHALMAYKGESSTAHMQQVCWGVKTFWPKYKSWKKKQQKSSISQLLAPLHLIPQSPSMVHL